MEYQPAPAPISADPDIAMYLEGELNRLAVELERNVNRRLGFNILHQPEEKPRDGEIVWADGSDWDPGSGAGPYAYIGGTYFALFSGAGLTEVKAGDVNSETATNGQYLAADGSGGASWQDVPASGEANTSSNDGTGEGLAKAKNGVDLPFKSLKAGQGVGLSADADEVEITAQDTRVDHGTQSSGTVTLDYSAGRVHEITVGGDITIAISNWPASGTPADMEIILYDADAHTVTLPSWTWSGGSAPALSSHERIILRTDDGGTTVYAMQGFSATADTVDWGDIGGNEVDAAQSIQDHGTVSSGTETLNLNDGLTHKVTAGGDFTVAVSNWPASGKRGELEIIAVDWGAHTVTLPAAWGWGDAGAPTFTSSGTDYIILRTNDGGTTVHAMLAGQGF